MGVPTPPKDGTGVALWLAALKTNRLGVTCDDDATSGDWARAAGCEKRRCCALGVGGIITEMRYANAMEKSGAAMAMEVQSQEPKTRPVRKKWTPRHATPHTSATSHRHTTKTANNDTRLSVEVFLHLHNPIHPPPDTIYQMT